MKSLCLKRISQVSLRPRTLVENSSKSYNNLGLVKASLSLILPLWVSAVAPRALAQENTAGDSSTPLVYNVENTGASYPTPSFPSFAQLPIVRPLPDPFRFADGTRDTSFSNWERRRNEIKAAIEKYEIGPKPDCSDCTITANYVPAVAPATRGRLTVTVTRNGKSLIISTGVYIPTGMGSGPFPAMIPMVSTSTSSTGTLGRGSLPAASFTGKAIASVDFPHNNITTYGRPATTDAFYQLYPELCAGAACAGGSNSGQYAAWSWGVSRLIDGIIIATHQSVNPLPIDVSHLAVTGCSYAGKMALFAGAFDERIALTVAQENGGGGQPSWRVSHDIEALRAVESIDVTDYNWFGSQMRQFNGNNIYKLPEDHHELAAMIAPRALLETGNTNFYWLSNGSNYVSSRATQRVYNEFGIGDRFGFYIDGGHFHCATLPAEAPAVGAFVDKFMLGQLTADTDVEVYPNGPGQPTTLPAGNGAGNAKTPNYPYYFPTMDYQRWTAWWGTNNPQFPNNWNTGGTVNLMMSNNMKADSGDTVLAGYDLYLDGSHPAATVTVENANIQADVSCPDGSFYTLAVPLPQNQAFSIPASNNDWFPSPVQKSPLVYQGSATASVCRGGVAKSTYFSALGIQDGSSGDPAGPGIVSTDTVDPLNVRFHCSDDNNGSGGHWSPTIAVNPNPPN